MRRPNRLAVLASTVTTPLLAPLTGATAAGTPAEVVSRNDDAFGTEVIGLWIAVAGLVGTIGSDSTQ